MNAVVPEMGRGRGRRAAGIGVAGLVLLAVTLGAVAHVWVRLKGLELAYELGNQRRINSELQEQQQRLKIEIGMLKEPTRVVTLARDQLKMGPPRAEDLRRVSAKGAR